MDGTLIKRTLRPGYRAVVDMTGARRWKARYRDDLMRLPLTAAYPYDAEAKLLRSIGVDPVVIDVGANKGKYAIALEDVVGQRNLYLFEPLPHLARQLRRRFRHAHVFDVALSDTDGRQRIRLPYIDGRRIDSRATLMPHSEPNQTGSTEIDVRLRTLDGVVRGLELPSVGLVKIDVEGHEAAVLDGATQTVERFTPLLLVEIEARHHDVPITDVFAKVTRLGYAGYYLDQETFTLHGLADFDPARDQDERHLVSNELSRYRNNFFFVPPAREDAFVERTTTFLEREQKLAEAAPGAN